MVTGSESFPTSGYIFLSLLLLRSFTGLPGSGRWGCAHVGEGDLGAGSESFARIHSHSSLSLTLRFILPPPLIFDLLVEKRGQLMMTFD